MRKNSLSKDGLSLTQAQNISNLCNQRALDIKAELNSVNNASKTLEVGGKNYTETEGKKLPENTMELIMELAQAHACQSFLMENIKAKDNLLKELKNKDFEYDVDYPEKPALDYFQQTPSVGEEWGWEQLTVSEYNEYLEAEAYAAHIGQFIHKKGILDELRTELPKIKALEWIIIKDGEKTPVMVKKHHTSEELLDLHNKFSAKHREYEKRVNYFKAKVKTLVTLENSRIAQVNSDKQAEVNVKNKALLAEYDSKVSDWNANYLVTQQNFEKERHNEISVVAAYRIEVDPRFEELINKYDSMIGE